MTKETIHFAEKARIEKAILRNKYYEKYGKPCTKCKDVKPVKEFYKRGKYYFSSCIECAKTNGCKNPGKNRRSIKLRKKGFKICPVCNAVKLLSEFNGKKAYGKCKICKSEEFNKSTQNSSHPKHRQYIKMLIASRYGIKISNIPDEMIEAILLERKILREMYTKYDGIKFKDNVSLGKYIEEKHGIYWHRTTNRLNHGATIKECFLPTPEYRTIKMREWYYNKYPQYKK